MMLIPDLEAPARYITLSAVIVLLLALSPIKAQTLDPGFQVPEILANSTLKAALKLPNGKILIRGNFTKVAGEARNNLARLLPDGTLDHRFVSQAGSFNVQAMAGQADGKILLGGQEENPDGTFTRKVIRLHEDGALEAGFRIELEAYNGGYLLTSLATQPDGKILAGGYFKVKGADYFDVVRFKADGTLDPDFSVRITPFDGGPAIPDFHVNGIIAEPNGQILVGGSFSRVNGADKADLVRLNPDGKVDDSFTNAALGGVKSFIRQADGKILLLGAYGRARDDKTYIVARLHANGLWDNGFAALVEYNGEVNSADALALLPDQKILVGGTFFSGNTGKKETMLRLHADGSVDSGFKFGLPSSQISSICTLSGNKILINGNFNKGATREYTHIARLEANGTEDHTYAIRARHGVPVLTVRQPDGKIVIYGGFTTVQNQLHPGIARLLADGRLDQDFNPQFENNDVLSVYGVALLSTGQIVVGGAFDKVNGVARKALVKLNGNGTVDESFAVSLTALGGSPAIRSLLVQPNDQIVLSGIFNEVQGAARTNFARIDRDGTLDDTFKTAVVRLSAINLYDQPDGGGSGKVVARGLVQFKDNAGKDFYRNLFRLNPDGSLDNTFILDDAKFATTSCVALQPDGKLLVGGKLINDRNFKLYRFSRDGAPEVDFNVSVGKENEIIAAVTPYANGQILLGGYFTSVNAISRTHLVRLQANGTVDADFNARLTEERYVSGMQILPDNSILIRRVYVYAGGNTTNPLQKLVSGLPSPDAPSHLTATALGSNQIHLTWADNAANETNYEVESASAENGTYSVVASLAADATTYSHTGLNAGATYYYRVRAKINNGYSGYSNQVQATLAKRSQTIAFTDIPAKNEEDAAFMVEATSSSGLAVSFEIVSGPAVLAGQSVTLTGAGKVTIRVRQEGNHTYAAATPMKITFCVIPTRPVITANGAQLTLSKTAANYQYQWLRNDVVIPDATAATYTATQAGNYTVVVKADNCTAATSDPEQVDVSVLDDNLTESAVLVYPNPANAHLFIKTEAKKNKKINLRLISAGGSVVWHKELMETNNSTPQKIDTAGLAKGMYVLQVHTETGIHFQKVILQ